MLAHDVVGIGSVEAAEVVEIGSVVTIQDGALRQVWQIVPPEESDPFANLMNAESALARALLGHRVGDEVQVQGSRRTSPIVILAIESGRG
jgi:transcription elongation factor GreA